MDDFGGDAKACVRTALRYLSRDKWQEVSMAIGTAEYHVAPHATKSLPARAENRRKGRLSALRAHTKAPHKIDFHRKTLRNAKGA